MGVFEDLMDANYGMGWAVLTFAICGMALLLAIETINDPSIGNVVVLAALVVVAPLTAWFTYRSAVMQLRGELV